MPKHKQFLEKPKKTSKHAAPLPTTADEYLAAGVDFEEAGEKWRGGDAVKSTRFFVRALDAYEEGLKKFPQSFDLAYNKARLQYEITQHPKILEQLPSSLLELLQTALDSSRYALSLNSEDADALFNTGQLLNKFADAHVFEEPAAHLEEALWLFELCLHQQCEAFKKFQKYVIESEEGVESASQDVDMTDTSASSNIIQSESPTAPQDQAAIQGQAWALIVQPTTQDTMLDTIIAQLETLAKLAEEVNPTDSKFASFIVTYYKDKIRPYLKDITPSATKESELNLAEANYKSAEANMQYHQKSISFTDYETVVMNVYTTVDMSANPQALCDYAESLIAFAAIVRVLDVHCDPYLTQRWTALTNAQNSFTAASKIKDVEYKYQIYLKKGDVELLRFQLGEQGKYGPALTNKETLLSNAGKFYRGAMKFAENGELGESLPEAKIKVLIAEALGRNAVGKPWVSDGDCGTIAEAVRDGVVSREQLARLGVDLSKIPSYGL